MKIISRKFSINISTYVLILLYYLSGYFKNIIMILFIVLFHEIGHIFFSKIFKIKIISVTIYPFGGLTKIEKLFNYDMNKDLLISLGGIMFQVLLFIVFNYLKILNYQNLTLFNKYNLYIMLFNILPIIPLDGYLIFNNIINRFFGYYDSLYISFALSIISLLFFLIYNYNNIFVLFYLTYNNYLYYKNLKYNYKRFLLERMIYDLEFKNCIYFNHQNINKIRRDKYCYFFNDNSYVSERNILYKMFDNS